MKAKTLYSTQIILRFLWTAVAIILAIVVIKCTFMRIDHTIDEDFMGLLVIVHAGVVIFNIGIRSDYNYVPISVPITTILFGLVRNSYENYIIYNPAIIVSTIEIATALITIYLLRKKQKQEKKKEKKDDRLSGKSCSREGLKLGLKKNCYTVGLQWKCNQNMEQKIGH